MMVCWCLKNWRRHETNHTWNNTHTHTFPHFLLFLHLLLLSMHLSLPPVCFPSSCSSLFLLLLLILIASVSLMLCLLAELCCRKCVSLSFSRCLALSRSLSVDAWLCWHTSYSSKSSKYLNVLTSHTHTYIHTHQHSEMVKWWKFSAPSLPLSLSLWFFCSVSL